MLQFFLLKETDFYNHNIGSFCSVNKFKGNCHYYSLDISEKPLAWLLCNFFSVSSAKFFLKSRFLIWLISFCDFWKFSLSVSYNALRKIYYNKRLFAFFQERILNFHKEFRHSLPKNLCQDKSMQFSDHPRAPKINLSSVKICNIRKLNLNIDYRGRGRKLVKIILETWNLVLKYTHIFSFRKYII